MQTNVTILTLSEQLADLFQLISSPARIAILLTIGRGEACVCHLEAVLGWRQAYISQHLMILRKAGLLQDRREGRYVYYRLTREAILALVREAAALSGIDPEQVNRLTDPGPDSRCECPHCAVQQIGLP